MNLSMSSTEYLLQEVQNKFFVLQSNLQKCLEENEKLHQNYKTARVAIDQSLQQHIETFQCRSKWLKCHAENIFHLKEETLSEQISNLKTTLTALEKCLTCSVEDSNDARMRATALQALRLVGENSLYLTETGALSFKSDDKLMEKTIISFGEIDLQRNEHDDVVSTFSDDDVDGGFLMNEKPVRSKLVETDGKSIEMVNATPISVNTDNESITKHNKAYRIAGLQSAGLQSAGLQSAGLKAGLQTAQDEGWLFRSCKGETYSADLKCSKGYQSDESEQPDEIWVFSKNNANLNNETTCAVDNETTCAVDNEEPAWLVAKPSAKMSSQCKHLDEISWIKRPVNRRYQQVTDTSDGNNSVIKNPLMSAEIFGTGNEELDITGQAVITSSKTTNIDYVKCDVTLTDYLHPKQNSTQFDMSSVKSQTNENLQQFKELRDRPLSAYLRVQKNPSTRADHTLCNWLVGKSKVQCDECNNTTCKFENSKGQVWIRTAGDW